jgi:hypothetical protein
LFRARPSGTRQVMKAQEQKFFASFFQKRRPFFLFGGNHK